MTYQRGYKTCNKCGVQHLHWVSIGGFWRLSNDPKGKDLHKCKTYESEKVIKDKKEKEAAKKLKINQRIQIIYDKAGAINMFGRIISVDNTDSWASEWYGIELDNVVAFGHNCLGLCTMGRGYYVHMSSVKEADNTLDFG